MAIELQKAVAVQSERRFVLQRSSPEIREVVAAIGEPPTSAWVALSPMPWEEAVGHVRRWLSGPMQWSDGTTSPALTIEDVRMFERVEHIDQPCALFEASELLATPPPAAPA